MDYGLCFGLFFLDVLPCLVALLFVDCSSFAFSSEIVIFFFFLLDREDESKTVWRTRNVRNWLARLDGEDGEVDVEMILGSTLSSNTPRVVS